uniref:Uncharacterized protein n=1 Tax=Rhizophagus irregularis (strain DAOM 181602 / DAOM 197198 / MUCL 43194) TaxID=747089 RepID=U9SSX3_RHIID
MECDTNKVIARITRNIESHLTNFKSKTDYDILVSGGTPGIVPFEWKNNHIEGLYIDFSDDCQLDSYDDKLT